MNDTMEKPARLFSLMALSLFVLAGVFPTSGLGEVLIKIVPFSLDSILTILIILPLDNS